MFAKTRDARTNKKVLIVSAWAILSRIYILIRWGTLWSEADGTTLSLCIKNIIDNGGISLKGPLYENGFGYELLGAMIVDVSGMPVSIFQFVASKFIALLPLVAAYCLYRNVTSSSSTSLLATLILSISAIFLGSTNVGTHDAYTVTLMILLLVAVYKTHLLQKVPPKYLSIIIILSLLGMASYNVYISTMLAFVLSTSYLINGALNWLFSRGNHTSNTFFLIRNTSLLSVFSFAIGFWAYPLAGNVLFGYKHFATQLLVLLTSLTPNPRALREAIELSYGSVYSLIFCQIYDVGIAALFIVVFIYVLTSLRGLRAEVWNRMIFIFSVAGAFTFLGAIAIGYDFSGDPIFGHAMVRMYMFLVIFISLAVAMFFYSEKNFHSRKIRGKRFFKVIVVFLIVVGPPATLLHTTGDPIVQNTWPFYTQQELMGLKWGETHMRNLSSVYVGVQTQRLSNAYYANANIETFTNMFPFGTLNSTKFYFLSDLVKYQAELLGINIGHHAGGSKSIIYSSGNVRILTASTHLRGESILSEG